jgi:hypothetical protein
MPNQFCRYLSNGYTFFLTEGSANVSPCCWYQNPTKFNVDQMRNSRQEWNAITDWTNGCIKCKVLEESDNQSMRQASINWIPDDETTDYPVSIDINLDHECNAACIICNEDYSSLWVKENSKIQNKVIAIKNELTEVDHIIDQIVSTVSLDHLRYVKFFGGEPLFTDTHLKFISHIPHPENVTLHYTTNGSIYPNQKTLEAWASFKTVIFAASLDGVDQQFNYVRWPLPWHKVSENILRLRNNKDVWNVMFRVEFTANFLNTYYYDRVEKWVSENLSTNLGGNATEINLHPCWGDWALEKMPDSIRTMVLEKYPDTHAIHKLVANLPPATSLDSWREFVAKWDLRRNNSWQTAFPELAQYL